VIWGAAFGADPAPRDPADELLGRHVDEEHAPDPLPLLGERRVEGLCLGDGAGESVQDRATRGGGSGQLGHEHADRRLVGDELPALHEFVRLRAEGRVGLDGSTEQVAGGQVREVQAAREDRGLGPLARPDGTDEQQDQTLAAGRGRRIGHLMKPS
jgi:hypothetical protein